MVDASFRGHAVCVPSGFRVASLFPVVRPGAPSSVLSPRWHNTLLWMASKDGGACKPPNLGVVLCSGLHRSKIHYTCPAKTGCVAQKDLSGSSHLIKFSGGRASKVCIYIYMPIVSAIQKSSKR